MVGVFADGEQDQNPMPTPHRIVKTNLFLTIFLPTFFDPQALSNRLCQYPNLNCFFPKVSSIFGIYGKRGSLG